MPFTPISTLPNDPTNPLDRPLVRIFFSGQLILTPTSPMPPGDRNCEVLVNRSAINHQFSVEVRQKRPKHPDVLVARHFVPLVPADTQLSTSASPLDHGMLIGVVSGAGPGTEPRGVKGYNGATTLEGSNLAEAMSLTELHVPPLPPADLTIDKDAGRPSILLNDATLYTAERSVGQFDIVKDGGMPQMLRTFASLIGANIYPTSKQVVVMQWKQDGKLVTLTFVPPPPAPPPDELFSYEVYVSNDPLFDPGALVDNAPITHDELKEYYRMHPGVPFRERFALRRPTTAPPVPPPTPSRGSPRIPCMPLLGEG
jgi:hypothetical protein